MSAIFDGQFDASPDRRPIGLDPNQLNINPIISVAGALVERAVIPVPRYHPAKLNVNGWLPIVKKIANRHAMPLLQTAGPRGSRYIDELFSFHISEQHIGDEGAVRWSARSQVEVQIAIVIHISEIGPHRHGHLVQTHLHAHILKTLSISVSVELVGLRRGRQIKVAANNV